MSNQHIQKPLNSFFLYRRSKKEEICRKYKIRKSHEVSSKAAEMWAKESQEVKDYFQHISLQSHDEFKVLHPDYDWQPWIDKSRKSKYKAAKGLPLSPVYTPIAGSIPPGVSLDVYEATLLENDNSFLSNKTISQGPNSEDGFDSLLSPALSSCDIL
ncbi:hypothetical protein HDV04_002335 [Boothiomyces sp. JEL0838]|nr:hypothetical protein HDV04_002529 [Boothiomyces sp. JEL0838]KAJ3313174.1 hypothetical protein HDV04_002335 [Boothiomyces sp. JEL0838]